MNPILDKDLDKLFQKRFGEFEIEPSEAIWERISETMDQKSKRKVFDPTFWMAAASVLILISAGLWFYRPVEVIKLHGNETMAKQSLNNSELPLVNEAIIADDLQEDKEPIQPQFKDVSLAIAPPIKLKEIHLSEMITLPEPKLKSAALQEPVVVAIALAPKKVSVAKPEKLPKVPNRYTGDQSTLDVTQPDMMAKAYLPEEASGFSDRENRGQAKIRSVGSLLNFVIARVDKREDKFIEFKDGKEGSEVSGINLGLVKIKGRK